MNPRKPTHPNPVMIFMLGPLFALLSFLTIQRAMEASSPIDAFLFAVLGTFFVTLSVGWIVYVALLLKFRGTDRRK